MSQWNPQILDTHIAPGVSTFTRANIPDLSGRFPQAEFWTTNYFLNSVNRQSFGDKARQLALGYLRRASLAHSAYNEARRLTLDYLDGNNPHKPRVGRYYRAVAQWEYFAIEASIALDIFRWFTGRSSFAKGDGSKEDRLYHIANKVKHVGPDIANKGMYTATDTVSLWLTDVGLNSFGIDRNSANTVVTYAEAAEFMVETADRAEEIQDPMSLAERIKADATSQAGQTPPVPPST